MGLASEADNEVKMGLFSPSITYFAKLIKFRIMYVRNIFGKIK